MSPQVATKPVPFPLTCNISERVNAGVESALTPMALLKVFSPMENAVAPAPESVTQWLELEVLLNPICSTKLNT